MNRFVMSYLLFRGRDKNIVGEHFLSVFQNHDTNIDDESLIKISIQCSLDFCYKEMLVN